MKTKKLLQLALAVAWGNVNAQCLGSSSPDELQQSYYNQTQAFGPQCSANFAGAPQYELQSTYVPDYLNQQDPVITVKMVMHIFYPSTDATSGHLNFNPSNDPFRGVPAVMARVNQMTDGFDRYSDPRSGYLPYVLPNTGMKDSRVRYEFQIYWYQSDVFWFGTANGQPSSPSNPVTKYPVDALDYIYANYPDRLKEGLPIVYTQHSQWQGVHQPATNFVIPYIAVGHVAAIDPPSLAFNTNFGVRQLRHEIAHAFGLYHTYYGGSCYPNAPSSSPETFNYTTHKLDCSNPDYLSDVFEPNSLVGQYSYPSAGACNGPAGNCAANYESGNMVTNNILSVQDGGWMSDLQMGRRIRALHLPTLIRQYVKDRESYNETNSVWSINVNETWDFDINVYRDIIVRSGNTLTIKCKVGMARRGRIIVEKNAKLVIDGGIVNTWCKRGLWRGIEIDGVGNLPQTINNTGFDSDHGIVEVINGGTISNAEIGIKAGRTTYFTDNHINGTEGGIVKIDAANFINNKIDLFFYNYSQNNISEIRNSIFETNGIVGLDVTTGNPIPPHEHIKVFGSNLKVEGCTFRYTAGNLYQSSDQGLGIFSTNSNLIVDKSCPGNISPCPNGGTRSKFNDLTVGVYIENTNPMYPGEILRSDFNNCVEYAVINHNNLLFNFRANNIVGSGVYMHKSKYYNIQENDFSSSNWSDIGVTAYDSKGGVHNVYANKFRDLNTGILCLDENAPNGTVLSPQNNFEGIKMNCNDFTNGGMSSNLLDIVVGTSVAPVPYIMYFQGGISPNSPSKLVRNLYNAPNFGLENKFNIDPNSTQIGIWHPVGSGAYQNPANPNPVQASPLLNIGTYNNISWTWLNDCAPNPLYRGGNTGSLADIETHIQEVRGETEVDYTELQNSVATKLSILLGKDLNDNYKANALNTLHSNQWNAFDNEIMEVYTYMRLRMFDSASVHIDSLPTMWGDYKDLLHVVNFHEQYPDSIPGAQVLSFISNYSANELKVGNGTAQTLNKIYNGTGYSLPTKSQNYYRSSSPTNVMEYKSAGKYSISPNPFAASIQIQVSNNEDAKGIVVHDLLGKLMEESKLDTSGNTTVNLESLPKGVYFISILDDKGAVLNTQKLCKSN